MLEKLFRSKKEKKLKEEKENLEKEIEKLKNEVRKKDGFLKCKNTIINERDENLKEDWKDMEEKLKKYYIENNNLRQSLEKSEKIIPQSYFSYTYLIPIAKYLSEVRFKDLMNILELKGVRYAQDLNEFIIENISVEEKLKQDLRKKFERFQKFEINWEMKTYLLKGEKISKLYFKHRKFVNIMLNENKEFISDLLSYNFEKLVNEGYTIDEIEELKIKYQNYIEIFMVENLS